MTKISSTTTKSKTLPTSSYTMENVPSMSKVEGLSSPQSSEGENTQDAFSIVKFEFDFFLNNPGAFIRNAFCYLLLWMTPFIIVTVVYSALLLYMQLLIPVKNCDNLPGNIKNHRTHYKQPIPVEHNQEAINMINAMIEQSLRPPVEREIMEQFSKPEYGIIKYNMDEIEFFVLGNYNVTCDYRKYESPALHLECLPYKYNPEFFSVDNEVPCDKVQQLAIDAKSERDVPPIIKMYIDAIMKEQERDPAKVCEILNKITHRLGIYLLIEPPSRTKSTWPETDVVQDTTPLISPTTTTTTTVSDNATSDEEIRLRNEEIKKEDLRAAVTIAQVIEIYKKVEKELSKGLDNKSEQHSETKTVGLENETKIEEGTKVEPKRSTESYAEIEGHPKIQVEKHYIKKRSPARASNQNKRRISSTARPTTKPPVTSENSDSTTGAGDLITTKTSGASGYTTPSTTNADKEVLITSTEVSEKEGTVTTGKPGKFFAGATTTRY